MKTKMHWRLTALMTTLLMLGHWGAIAQEDWPHQSTDWQDPLFQARVQGHYDWIGTGPGRLALFVVIALDELGEPYQLPMEVWRISTANRDIESFPRRNEVDSGSMYPQPPKDWEDREYLVQYLSGNESPEEGFFEDRLTEEAGADTYYLMGNIYYLQRKYPEAIQNYRKAIDEFPRFRLAHQNLAYAYITLNDCENALPAAISAAEYGALTPRLKGVEGYCSLQQGDFNRAAQALAMARMLDPDNEIWTPLQIQALAGLGRVDQAALLLEKYIEKFGISAENVDQLLSLYRRNSDQDGILAVLEIKKRAGLLNDSQKQELSSLKIANGLGPVLADDELLDFMARTPPASEQMAEMLEALAYTASQRSSEVMDIAVNREYPDLPGKPRARLYVAQAKVLVNMDRLQDSLAKIEAVLQEYPTDCDALLLGARVLNAQGERDAAITFLDRAENSSAECQRTSLTTRVEVMLSRGEYVQAFQLYEEDSRQKYISGQLEDRRAKELKQALADLVARITQ